MPILTELKEIREDLNAEGWEDVNYICSRFSHRERDQLRIVWCGWEHFSGNDTYPVPNPNPEKSPEEAWDYCCFNNVSYWVGEYGELRRDLLNFLIQQFEDK